MALGAQIREKPLYSDAWAVARETMRRVQYNLELVAPRLRELGYRFIHDQELDKKHATLQEIEWIQANPPFRTRPSATIGEQLDALERRVGVLPLSVRAFYEEIGGVNFVGWYQGKPLREASLTEEYENAPGGFDPVFVYAFDPDLVEEGGVWMYPQEDDWLHIGAEDTQTSPPEGRSSLIIAPDVYHKANLSGGPPLEIHLQDAHADAPLLYESHQTTFVSYLRLCCSYAGLPALATFSHPLRKNCMICAWACCHYE